MLPIRGAPMMLRRRRGAVCDDNIFVHRSFAVVYRRTPGRLHRGVRGKQLATHGEDRWVSD